MHSPSVGCPDVRFYWCGLCWRREPLVQSDQTGHASDDAEAVERAAENAEQNRNRTNINQGKYRKIQSLLFWFKGRWITVFWGQSGTFSPWEIVKTIEYTGFIPIKSCGNVPKASAVGAKIKQKMVSFLSFFNLWRIQRFCIKSHLVWNWYKYIFKSCCIRCEMTFSYDSVSDKRKSMKRRAHRILNGQNVQI